MSQVIDRIKFPAGVAVGIAVAIGLVGLGVHMSDHPATGAAAAGTTSTSTDVRLVSYSSRVPASVDDDDYPMPFKGYAFDSATSSAAPDKWGGFDSRNCTSFVAWRVTSRDNFDMAAWIAKNGAPGNAKNWLNAFGSTVRHDSTPTPGSAAVMTSGRWGHVAWVKSVNDNGTIVVEDYNALVTGEYGSWTVPATDFSGYLHFEDARPQQTAPTPVKAPLTVTTNTRSQGGGTPDLQGSSGVALQGASGTKLQNTGVPPQGSSAAGLQGTANSGAGAGTNDQQQQDAAAAAERQRQEAAAAAERQRQADADAAAQRQRQADADAAAQRQRIYDQQHPVYPVMNTSETAPDGVWWRNSPNQDDTSRTAGYGVYAGDKIRLTCYSMGGPAVNGSHVWYRAVDLSRTWNGGESAGWISAHYVNDGTGFDQVAPNVQPC